MAGFLDRTWTRGISCLASCRSAAVAPTTALLLIPLGGTLAMAVEVGNWYFFQRAMQNAADSSALAAAINNKNSGSTFTLEANSVAAKYGFVGGQNDVTMNTATVTCPTGTTAGATCYKVDITKTLPLSFSRLVGFNGNTAYGSGRGQKILASAIAATGSGTGHQYCIFALNSFQSNGGPKPDLQGCGIYVNGDMTCNGHNLNADYGDATGDNRGCGVTQNDNVTPIPDPYTGLSANLPTFTTCGGSFPQIPSKKNDPALPGTNSLTGTISADKLICGDAQLSGDVTLTGTAQTLTIANGMLDLNGHKITTASGAGATVIFTGNNTSGYAHYPSGSGTLDIAAPKTGVWKGVALYQNPALTVSNDINISYSGNSPTWNITGLVYLSKASVSFSGAVNKSSNGQNCIVWVVYSMLVNGTAYMLKDDPATCGSAGVSLPGSALVREKLVQ